MFKDTPNGQTHSYEDGCNPPHKIDWKDTIYNPQEPAEPAEPQTAKEWFTQSELDFISNLIEQVIDEMPTDDDLNDAEYPWQGINKLKQKLRDKYLN